MADWEDWEAEAEKPQVQPVKDKKFADEDDEAVPIEQQPDIKVQSQPKNPENVAKKEKAAKIAKKWEEKEKEYQDVFNEKRGPLTAEERKKAELLSKESDQKNTIDLFGGFISQNEQQDLKSEKAFVEFAQKVAGIVMKEDRKKYIQEFMKELLQQVYPKLTSQEYEEIHSKCTTLFNQKQKDEKGPLQKKKTATKINASKASNAKVMGYDEYEDEDDGAKYDNDDFM